MNSEAYLINGESSPPRVDHKPGISLQPNPSLLRVLLAETWKILQVTFRHIGGWCGDVSRTRRRCLLRVDAWPLAIHGRLNHLGYR